MPHVHVKASCTFVKHIQMLSDVHISTRTVATDRLNLSSECSDLPSHCQLGCSSLNMVSNDQ